MSVSLYGWALALVLLQPSRCPPIWRPSQRQSVVFGMASDIPDSPSMGSSSSRLVVVAVALVALLILGYFALGMPGMDHGPAPEADHEQMDM